MAFSTPVLFLVFNRPEHTQRVFEQIRRIQPSQLYVSADGPRGHVATDAERCRLTRAVVDRIDWPCSVHTHFQAENLGCRRAVMDGISWFFQQVEEGIILEDDCLPGEAFFSFCAQMLEQYRDDEEVMHISGNNPAPSAFSQFSGNSTVFSRMPFIWGWATWRRAWQRYDAHFQALDETWPGLPGDYSLFSDDTTARRYLFDKFQRTRDGEIDTWDYAWFYTILKNRGLCVTPAANLVQNIGFDQNGTHTTSSPNFRSNKTQTFSSGISLPASRRPDKDLERTFFHAAQKGRFGLFLRSLAPWYFFKPLPRQSKSALPGFWSLRRFAFLR